MRRLLKNIRKYFKIFEKIQKVVLPDWLPARLAAYTFWSLLLLLLMLLLCSVALAVASKNSLLQPESEPMKFKRVL